MCIPRVSSERREYMTVQLLDGSNNVISDTSTAMYDASLHAFSLVSSKLHLVWIATVCGKLELPPSIAEHLWYVMDVDRNGAAAHCELFAHRYQCRYDSMAFLLTSRTLTLSCQLR